MSLCFHTRRHELVSHELVLPVAVCAVGRVSAGAGGCGEEVGAWASHIGVASSGHSANGSMQHARARVAARARGGGARAYASCRAKVAGLAGSGCRAVPCRENRKDGAIIMYICMYVCTETKAQTTGTSTRVTSGGPVAGRHVGCLPTLFRRLGSVPGRCSVLAVGVLWCSVGSSTPSYPF